MAITRLGGANAITGTIPQGNIANASLGAVTALPAAISTGKVLQVKYMQSSSGAGLSGTSLVDTALTNTITPSSSSNKILVQFVLQAKLEGSNNEGYGTAIKRAISGGATTTLDEMASFYNYYTAGSSEIGTVSPSFFEDSPSTTSEITYTIQVKGNNANAVQIPNTGFNSMILMEISA